MKPIGRKRWAIAEGHIPSWSKNPEPEFLSHEATCLLNVFKDETNVESTIFFSDGGPVGPYRITKPAGRTKHIRFNNIEDPETIFRQTQYLSVIEYEVPTVVQETRLDSRQAEDALLSVIAHSDRG